MLLCSGNPPPEVIWFHNENEIQESEDFHFEQKGGRHSLCIQEVFPEDTGTYTCEAWNSAGEVRTQAVLTVQGEPDLLWGQGDGDFQILKKPFRGEGNTGDHSGPIAASEADHCLHLKLLQSGASFPAF